ncbi:N-acetyltransferase 5 [Caligus rogercresseyi]|uniref:N-alpha-acetyltransferase 20 n=1 Tax=Caligus rogercresseyi TaxID=217165 RepID=A0A7T8QUN0_CALRO|nr:N-acetyltransferase 5 [Caligus rogercresseyi]
MNALETISEKRRCYFVDLFVRVSNKVAINVYLNLGYCVYRMVLQYYSNEHFDEDAFDMRKSLSRDKDKKAMVPLEHPIHLSGLDDYFC